MRLLIRILIAVLVAALLIVILYVGITSPKVPSPLSTEVSGILLKFFAPILLVVVLVLVFRFLITLFPRSGIVVSFSDLDAESGAASASSRSLTAELLFFLEDPEPLAIKGLRMNTMPGTDQPAFGVVRPAQAMTQAPEFSSSKHPMKLGAVEFGLDDVARIFNLFFERPNQGSLVGWLSCGQGSAVAAAELTQRGFRRRKQGPWRATAVGEDARREVLARIAAQILVDVRDCRFTDSWQSLKACQDGIKIMRADAGMFNSAKARRCFEAALEYDSANWIARFYLALSLCAEEAGKPALALRHFRMLDQVLSVAEREQAFEDLRRVKLAEMKGQRIRRFFLAHRARMRAYVANRRDHQRLAAPPRLTGLLMHLVNYPECPFILQYNIAIAVEELQTIGGTREFEPPSDTGVIWKDPLECLRGIVASCDPRTSSSCSYPRYAELLGEREKLELSMFALSAQAHIISRRGGAGCLHAIEKLLEDLEHTVCQARDKARCFGLRVESWRTVETTRGVALASLGRVLAHDQELTANQEARNRLYEAIACEPYLVDAYLQLGRLYMHWQTYFAKNWQERAKSLLTRASEINPTCRQTKDEMFKLRALVIGTKKEPLKVMPLAPGPISTTAGGEAN